MTLHDRIREYYFTHLRELPDDKQFHFALRLSAWEHNPRAYQELERLKNLFVPDPATDEALRETLRDLIDNPPDANINAAGVREQYFAKYPQLRGIDFALFRVRHWETAYGIDGRRALLDLMPQNKLLALKDQLLKDQEALRMLSTYAINYLYLLERMILGNNAEDAIDLNALYELGSGYDLSRQEHLQLYIYLYTHCIIGDTNYYVRPLPEFGLPIYRRMLERLEAVIVEHYDKINLDNKLEFLVCCRICSYSTPLAERIDGECQKSLSDNGTFIVDSHGHHKQNDKTSLADSEHRNVLFIMSGSPYPHA